MIYCVSICRQEEDRGVIARMVASCTVYRRSVKPKTIKLVLASSLLSTRYKGVRSNAG